MFGDRRHGVYNLRIVNSSLEDDAEYQCQVGPAQMHKVIRANASLTVICKYSYNNVTIYIKKLSTFVLGNGTESESIIMFDICFF